MKTLQNEYGSPASVLTYFIGTIDDSLTSGEKAGIMERVKQTFGTRMWARWNLPAASFDARMAQEIAAEVEHQRLRYIEETAA